MKNLLLLLIVSVSISDCIYSQKVINPVDYRFKNGESGYSSFFSKNITFPVQDIRNGTIANSITRISIKPNGELDEIMIINPIDSAIDTEVLRVIDLSRSLWKRCDTISHNQMFYIQIAFSPSGYQPNICRSKNKQIRRLFPEPVIATVHEPILETMTKGDDSKIPVKKSSELSEKANNFLDKGKYEEALPFINELIKMDPFNRDLYKARIMINIRLNRPDLAEQDDNKIIDFAEGFSIDDLNKDQE